MNGFRLFVIMAAVCILVGLAVSYLPGCKPPDVGECTFDVDNKRYECPEEGK